jgi:hypothetical protein
MGDSNRAFINVTVRKTVTKANSRDKGSLMIMEGREVVAVGLADCRPRRRREDSVVVVMVDSACD